MVIGNSTVFMIKPCSPPHTNDEDRESCPTENEVRIDIHCIVHVANELKDGPQQGVSRAVFRGDGIMDVEARLQQVATVINQIDDPKVPRNIRKQAKETCENWLLNKGKKLDVRIAMSQSKLEELYEDPNIPPEFGTLILMINTELEKILTEIL
jgi:uncharacterized protein (UPF0147 family)